MNEPTPLKERPLSWLETLIGLFPIFVFGPLSVWLAFPYPYPEGSISQWFFTSENLLFVIFLLFGLIAGSVTGWRRWSFPYLGLGILVGKWILSESNQWLIATRALWLEATGLRQALGIWERPLLTISTFAYSLGVFALVLVAGYLLTRALGVHARIRQDWTQLSFGLYIVPVIALSGIDHDGVPVLTILFILPSVTLLLGALAYLRSTTRRSRVASLVLGLALAFSLAIIREWYFVLYAVILAGFVFMPWFLQAAAQADRAKTGETG